MIRDAMRRGRLAVLGTVPAAFRSAVEQAALVAGMDASAILEYFEPLQGWLKQQNKDQRCGW